MLLGELYIVYPVPNEIAYNYIFPLYRSIYIKKVIIGSVRIVIYRFHTDVHTCFDVAVSLMYSTLPIRILVVFVYTFIILGSKESVVYLRKMP